MSMIADILLSQLKDALRELELHDDVLKLERWSSQLKSNSQLEREAAAQHIVDRCHVRWWGDLNLQVPGEGDYPVYTFLDQVRAAVIAEVDGGSGL